MIFAGVLDAKRSSFKDIWSIVKYESENAKPLIWIIVLLIVIAAAFTMPVGAYMISCCKCTIETLLIKDDCTFIT